MGRLKINHTAKEIRDANIAMMIVVAVLNAVDFFIEGASVARYAAFVAPFIIGLSSVIIKDYRTPAILYAIGGIVISATATKGNFSGALLLMFSIYIFNTPRTNYILIGGSLIAIVIGHLKGENTIPDIALMIAMYCFAFRIYFK